jgi:hypothetical protein
MFVAVAVGLAAGCGGGSNQESAKPSAPAKAGYVNAIYPQAIAPQRVTCGMFDSQSPKAAALVEEVGKAAGATNDHSYVALRDVCQRSKPSAKPFRRAVKKLRAGEYG